VRTASIESQEKYTRAIEAKGKAIIESKKLGTVGAQELAKILKC